jgi:hypothetical protein
MTGPVLLLVSAIAFAAPPDRGESGFSVDTVPVQFAPAVDALVVPTTTSVALDAALADPPPAAVAGASPAVRSRRSALRIPRRPLRAVLNGQRLARPPGALSPTMDGGAQDPGRSDGIPPSGRGGLTP